MVAHTFLCESIVLAILRSRPSCILGSGRFEASRKFLTNFGGEVAGPAAIAAVASLLHVGWSAFFVVDPEPRNRSPPRKETIIEADTKFGVAVFGHSCSAKRCT